MSDGKLSFVHRVPRPVGRPSRFAKAADLWDKFVEYCDYVDANPWQMKSASNSLSDSEKSNMRQDVRVLQRAYTLHGFCAFCGIASKWADFKATNKGRNEQFANVIAQIENVVCSQQLDGALINQFNGNIVARLNGLEDYQVTQLVGKDGEEFKFPKFTADDIEELKRLNGVE